MPLRAVVLMGEDGINASDAIRVVRMAGADEPYVRDKPIFNLMHSTVAAPTSGLDRFKGVAVMIPTDKPCAFTDMGEKQTAHRFVHTYMYIKVHTYIHLLSRTPILATTIRRVD